MTTKEALKEGEPFISKCDKDGDPYLLVHFSQEDDYFKGVHERMGFADAIIVIKELVKYFGINSDVLSETLKNGN